ncbi:unnamed protein product, partial [Ectocarpus sp. 8 AP-2014]
TPNKKLFLEPVRTFSHGCIRVSGAVDFAKTLLAGSATGEQIDDILTSRKTTKLSTVKPFPVYIAYFTAEATAEGTVRYFPDVYNRDRLDLALSEYSTDCAA